MTDEELSKIRTILLTGLPISDGDKTRVKCPYNWEDNRIEVIFYNVSLGSTCPQYYIKFTVIRSDLKAIIEHERMMGEIQGRSLIGKRIVRNIFHSIQYILNCKPYEMHSYPNDNNNKCYYDLNFRPIDTRVENWNNTPYEKNKFNNFIPICNEDIYNIFMSAIENL